MRYLLIVLLIGFLACKKEGVSPTQKLAEVNKDTLLRIDLYGDSGVKYAIRFQVFDSITQVKVLDSSVAGRLMKKYKRYTPTQYNDTTGQQIYFKWSFNTLRSYKVFAEVHPSNYPTGYTSPYPTGYGYTVYGYKPYMYGPQSGSSVFYKGIWIDLK